jgi:hypothetical protein
MLICRPPERRTLLQVALISFPSRVPHPKLPPSRLCLIHDFPRFLPVSRVWIQGRPKVHLIDFRERPAQKLMERAVHHGNGTRSIVEKEDDGNMIDDGLEEFFLFFE